MKTTLKILITIILSAMFLQSCWLKKCENPDAEHCSWTMVEPGRTAPYIFKSKYGDSLICDAYAPTFGRLTGTGSSLDACNGEMYSCHISLALRIAREDIYWSTIRYKNDTYEEFNACNNCHESKISYKSDTMTTDLKTNGYIKFKQIQIIKNKGIQKININDTIYERVN